MDSRISELLDEANDQRGRMLGIIDRKVAAFECRFALL